MALLFVDSFDHYATADIQTKWTTLTSAGANLLPTIAAGGRRGSGSFRITDNQIGSTNVTGLLKTLGSVDPTCVMGFAFVLSSGSLLVSTVLLAPPVVLTASPYGVENIAVGVPGPNPEIP